MSTKELLAHQAQNRKATITRIDGAKAAIEKEIKSFGYYPENNGRVTVKELCKRAGVGYSTLKNRSHKATLKKAQDWLAGLKSIAPTAKADADVIKRQRTKELTEQVYTIAQKFNLFKIEYDRLLKKVSGLENSNTDLQIEITDLKRENVSLRRRVSELESAAAQLDGSNVIPFPPAS